MMKKTDSQARNIIRVNFPSISAMRDRTLDRDKLTNEENRKIYRRAIWAQSGPDWFGLMNYEAVFKAVEQGNQQLTDKLLEHSITRKLPAAIGIGRQLFRSDMGDELDIHAVNKGDVSRAWSSKRRVVKRARSNIKIVVDIGANCNVEASVLQCRGLAGAGLAMALEKAGYSVAVLGAFALNGAINNDNRQIVCTVQIKPAVGRISAGILASTVCLAGFWRTYGFAAILKTVDDMGLVADSNLGRVTAVQPLLLDEPATLSIVVPVSVVNDRTATEWIAQTIKMIEAGSRAA